MAKKVEELTLTVDLKQLQKILDEYHEGIMPFGAASRAINYLYEGTARTYTLRMQDKSTKLQEEAVLISRDMVETTKEQNRLIKELINVLKGAKNGK